jgi:hypothetical protein
MFRSLRTIITYIHECKNIIVTNMDPYQCMLYIIYCFLIDACLVMWMCMSVVCVYDVNLKCIIIQLMCIINLKKWY